VNAPYDKLETSPAVASTSSNPHQVSPFFQAVVAHFKCDEAAGALIDQTSNATAAPFGEPDSVPGVSGGARRLKPADGFSTPENLAQFNTTEKSWGCSIWFNFNAAPVIVAPLNMTSVSGGQWALAAMGPTLLKLVAVQPGGGDVTIEAHKIDSLVGRWTHVVFGFDWTSKTLSIWVDRVLRGTAQAPRGVGFSPTYTAPLQFNVNQAGFNKSDFAIDEVFYAVGAAPTQADVDRLHGGDELEPGFRAGLTGPAETQSLFAEASGEAFARPGLIPRIFLDGLHIPLNQVRNNPPHLMRFEARIDTRGLANGLHPLVTEWRWTDALAPDATTQTTVETDNGNNVYSKPSATPHGHPDGVAHIGRSGTIRFAYDSQDSEIYVGVYAFGPGEFADDRYGLQLRDEMLDANIGLESGAVLHYMTGNYANEQAWWNSTAGYRQAIKDQFARWTGPWSSPDDDMFWKLPESLVAWMQTPWFESGLKRWGAWRRGIGAQPPRFVVYKDEVNYAFGNDPESNANQFLALLAPLGGMNRVVAALKAGSDVPCAPGMFGVGPDVPVGYTRWLDPKYSDFVDQYHLPSLLTAPWTGQSLRQTAETLAWAAKHRDINRPLALNASLILGNVTKQADGSWLKTNASSSPRLIAGQLWVCLAYSATVLRAYYLQRFDDVLNDDSPPGTIYQQSVRPGAPEFHAFLGSARMVKDYTPMLLGVEQPTPFAGPDFLCAHRSSTQGRIWWAVNLSETPRVVQAVPDGAWAKGEILDQGNRSVTPPTTRVVPGNGVLVLSTRRGASR